MKYQMKVDACFTFVTLIRSCEYLHAINRWLNKLETSKSCWKTTDGCKIKLSMGDCHHILIPECVDVIPISESVFLFLMEFFLDED
jgi:hypothetical protein